VHFGSFVCSKLKIFDFFEDAVHSRHFSAADSRKPHPQTQTSDHDWGFLAEKKERREWEKEKERNQNLLKYSKLIMVAATRLQ